MGQSSLIELGGTWKPDILVTMAETAGITGASIALAGRHPLHALTSLRFFAAFGVVIHHLLSYGLLRNEHLAFGNPAVSFFFVLSGFVLTYGYHGRLRDVRAIWRFLYARFARLWPLHAVTFAVSAYQLFVLLKLPTSGSVDLALRNLALVQAWSSTPGVALSFNGPSWTISNEAFFYVCFPALVAVGAAIARRFTTAGILLATVLAASVGVPKLIDLSISSTSAPFYAGLFPPVRLLDFVVGVALGLLFLQSTTRSTTTPTTRFWWTSSEIGSVGLFLAAAWSAPSLPTWSTHSAMWVPFAAAIVLIFAHGRGHLSRGISVRPLRVLGEASYSLYMWHVVIMVQVLRARPIDYLSAYPKRGALIIIVISLIISLLSWRWIEMPARRWLLDRRVSGRPRSEPARLGGALRAFDRLARVTVPAVVILAVTFVCLHARGMQLTDFRLYVPDDAYYWHQLSIAASVGNGGGYTTYEEMPAQLWSHFGAWGPMYPLMFGGLLALVPIAPDQLPYLGMIAFVAMSIVALTIARVSWIRSLLIAAVLVMTWSMPLALITGMQEPFHFGIALVIAAVFSRTLISPNSRWPWIGITVTLVAAIFRPSWIFMVVPFVFAVMRGRSWRWRALIGAIVALGCLITLAVAMRMISPLPYDIPGDRVLHPSGPKDFVRALIDTTRLNLNVLTEPLAQYQSTRWVLVSVTALLIALIADTAVRLRSAHDANNTSQVLIIVAIVAAALLPLALFVTTYTIVTGMRHLGPHTVLALTIAVFTLPAIRSRYVGVGVAVSAAVLMAGVFSFRADFRTESNSRYRSQPVATFSDIAAHISYVSNAPSAWCNTLLIAAPNPFGPQMADLPRGIGASVILIPDGPIQPKSRWLLVAPTSKPQFAESTWTRYSSVIETTQGTLMRENDEAGCRA